MTRTSLRNVSCSIARTVDILSDAWAWLIVRDAFLGVRHFDEFRADLGISRKVLAQRLVDLTDAAILEKTPTSEGSARFEYRLTAKGLDLVPVLAALVDWGDRWEPTPGGPPLYLEHTDCHEAGVDISCANCGKRVDANTLQPWAGPGGSSRTGTAVIGTLIHRPSPRE